MCNAALECHAGNYQQDPGLVRYQNQQTCAGDINYPSDDEEKGELQGCEHASATLGKMVTRQTISKSFCVEGLA